MGKAQKGLWCVMTGSVGAAMLGGCASSVSDTLSGAVSGAPEWFEERRVEASREGYPKFSDIPPRPDDAGDTEQALLEQAELLAEAAAFEADPKARSPLEEDREDPADWAEKVRREVNAGGEPPS